MSRLSFQSSSSVHQLKSNFSNHKPAVDGGGVGQSPSYEQEEDVEPVYHQLPVTEIQLTHARTHARTELQMIKV